MKVKMFLIAVVLILAAQGSIFAAPLRDRHNGTETRTVDPAIEYDTLEEQVNVYIGAGNYAAAIPLLKRMHELKPRELTPVEWLGILYANIPEERPELTNAFFWLLEAEKMYSSNSDVYYNLTCIYSLKNDLVKAVMAIDKAIIFGSSNFEWISQDDDLFNFRDTPWWKGIADNYAQIGNLLTAFNEFVNIAGEKNFEERIDFYSAIIASLVDLAPHIPALRCNPISSLAYTYYNRVNYTLAVQYYLEALGIEGLVLGKDHPSYATSLNDLGSLYRSMGDYAQAERYNLEALSIRERVLGTDHPDYATSLNNLGSLYYNIGDYARAERFFLEALSIRERVLGKDHPYYASSLNNLGALYTSMGDYARAERYYLEASRIWEKALGKDHSNYAISLSNLGSLYCIIGDYEQAERCHLEAIDIEEKVLGKEHPSYSISLNNLGFLYYKMVDYAQAERHLREALSIRERVLGKDHPSYATALSNMGFLYRDMGDYESEETYLLEATSIFEKALGKDHPSYITSLDNVYALYLAKREYMHALPFKQEAYLLNTAQVNTNFSFLSEQQRNAYWDANSSSFELTYSLSWHYPVPESNILNYDNALFSKGLLLRTTNAVRDAIYSSGDETLIAQFEELGRLRRQISALRQSDGNEAYIQSLEAQAEALDKSLTQSSAAFREFQADLAVGWQNVRDNLQPNEAAIEFVSFIIYDQGSTNTTQYTALVLRPGMDAPVWVPLCEEGTLKEIFGKLDELKLSWTGPDNELQQAQIRLLYDEYGPALYNAVWRPLEEVLQGVTTVYYSPSGLLNKVSFSAIPVGDDSRLMDVYDLNLVSSTREVVYRQNNAVQLPRSAVVYGGLLYDLTEDRMRQEALAYQNQGTQISSALPQNFTRGGTWNYLFYTSTESNSIHRQLNDSDIPAVLYNAARGNKESFKSLDGRRTGIIHLATHGFFQNDIERNYEEQERLRNLGGGNRAFENPLMRSGLILAGGNNAWSGSPVEGIENGILFADDVARMNLLGAELVVLSACETGLGEVDNSEGVFGLQRAFKLAGAQTLVMSLWEVADRASSELMTTFYRNWLSGMSKQEAFKEAQRQIRSRYPEPFFWAAFVMMD